MNKITKTVLTAKVDLLKIDEILNRIEIYIQNNQKSRFILSALWCGDTDHADPSHPTRPQAFYRSHDNTCARSALSFQRDHGFSTFF